MVVNLYQKSALVSNPSFAYCSQISYPYLNYTIQREITPIFYTKGDNSGSDEIIYWIPVVLSYFC